jgi:hypothetical protein
VIGSVVTFHHETTLNEAILDIKRDRIQRKKDQLSIQMLQVPGDSQKARDSVVNTHMKGYDFF